MRAFRAVLTLIVLTFLAAPALAPAHAAERSPDVVWQEFLAALSRKDAATAKTMVAADAGPEFQSGIAAQIEAGGASKPLERLECKKRLEGDAVAKLGYLLPASGAEKAEALWVTFRKEGGGWKILDLAPTQSLDVTHIEIEAAAAGDSATGAPPATVGSGTGGAVGLAAAVPVLRKRLARIGQAEPFIKLVGNTCSIDLTTTDLTEAMARLLVRPGRFGLYRVAHDGDAGGRVLEETPKFGVKASQNHRITVVGEPVVTSANLKAVEISQSGVRLPMIQVDLDEAGRALLKAATSTIAAPTVSNEEHMVVAKSTPNELSLAGVLDDRVVSVFKVERPIVSGRFWLEGFVIVLEARLAAALIEAGPLPLPLRAVKVETR